ncbi:protease-associated domain-containing protein [Muricoccus vinaceus]|uniref:DUF732 domain-containing protein n=1 Tax=Muricoccus vinaceus TaxID=424704 RepID=A0ABV6IL78_9PROT
MRRSATFALATLLLATPAAGQSGTSAPEISPDVLERQLMRQLSQMDDATLIIGAGFGVSAPRCGWRDEAWGQDVTRLTMSVLTNSGYSTSDAARFSNAVERRTMDEVALAGREKFCADAAKLPAHAENLRLWDSAVATLRDVDRRRAQGR